MLQVQVKQLDTELQTLKSKMAKTTDAFDDWQLYNNLVKGYKDIILQLHILMNSSMRSGGLESIIRSTA